MRVSAGCLVDEIAHHASCTEMTLSLHHLRFELSAGMVAAGKSSAALSVGVHHAEYTANKGILPDAVRATLASDLR